MSEAARPRGHGRRRGAAEVVRVSSTVDSGGGGHEMVGDSLRSPSIQAGESPAPRPLPEGGLIAAVR